LDIKIKESMVQLQDAPKRASVTSEATERELELEAQLVEARSIIQEQVLFSHFSLLMAQRLFSSLRYYVLGETLHLLEISFDFC